MKTIAITGILGSGKSKVIEILALDYPVIDCDKIANELMIEGHEGYLKAQTSFSSYLVNQAFNRKALAAYVFNDKQALKKLEDIIHPLVLSEVFKQIKQYRKSMFVFIEVPLLFEVGWQKYFDYSVVVDTDIHSLYQRLKANRKMTDEEIQKILDNQLDLDAKKVLADYIIDNNGNIDDLKSAVSLFITVLKENSL